MTARQHDRPSLNYLAHQYICQKRCCLHEDVLRFFLNEVQQRTQEQGSYQCSAKKVARIVAIDVKSLWDKVKITTVTPQRIEKMILDYKDKYRNLFSVSYTSS